MRYWVVIALLILFTIKEYRRYKYILVSTVLWPVMWVFSLFALTQENYYTVSWTSLIVIIIGYMLFCFGFHLKCKPYDVREAVKHFQFDINANIVGLESVYFVSIAVAGIYLYLMRGQFSIVHFFDSFKQLYRTDVEISSGLKYLSFIPKCTMWYFSLIIAINRNNGTNSKTILIKLIVMIFINLIIMVPGFVRTDFLFTYLPVIMNLVVVSGAKDRSIVMVFSIAIAGFFLLFVSFAMLKHSYRYEGAIDVQASALDELYEYLGGSVVAFDQLRKADNIKWVNLNGTGQYTFNGLLGFIDRVLGTNFSPNTVQEFITISDHHTRTNVYTIFKWTGMDFGIIYSCLLQILYGFVHGILFKGIKDGKITCAFWYSAVMYGLIMMFFSDQYFSVGAMWTVTIIAYCFVVYLSNIKKCAR